MVDKKNLDKSWLDWLETNLNNGNDKKGLFRILLANNFEYQLIKDILDIDYYDSDIKNSFSQDWIHWINTNLSIGSNKDEMRRILWSNNFNEKLINEHLFLKTSNTKDYQDEKNQIFIPNGQKLDNSLVELYTLDNFLNNVECQEIIKLTKKYSKQSTVVNYNSDRNTSDWRTSLTCHLNDINENKEIISKINERICLTMNIKDSFSEPIQAQYYQVGKQFKPHTDYFDPGTNVDDVELRGNRTWTFMIYLNDVEIEGETYFPNINKSFKPQKGMALIWNNTDLYGNLNYNTLHQGKPVISGEKFIITKWFRQKSLDKLDLDPLIIPRRNLIHNYTTLGFKKIKIPFNLCCKLQDWYKININNFEKEYKIPELKNKDSNIINSFICHLDNNIKIHINNYIKPILEEWSSLELELTSIYGIRSYVNNSFLDMHTDIPETHIISCIIHIDDKSNNPWPLYIRDNYYRDHKIYFNSDEMVLYESARCLHGRPELFDGDYYRNLYVHYKPK